MAQFAQAEVKAGVFQDCSPCEEISECNPCDEVSCDPCEAICGTKKSKWFVTGYLEAGIFANEYGNKNFYLHGGHHPVFGSHSHNHVLYGNGGGYSPHPDATSLKPLQNVSNTGLQVNQLYVSVGKSVDGSHGWDFGGTVDFTFGTDASMVQAAGLEYNTGHLDSWGTGDYYSAFAQAYFEAAYKKWNVKVGKFYAPFGSNGYQSTSRFFYSLADTFAFVPATAGGAYATYTVNDELTVYGGWVQPDQFGETSHNNAFLGGAIWQVSKRLNVHYALGIGKNDYQGADTDYFVNSLVTTYQINKKWKYIFDWSLANYTDNTNKADPHSGTYGINNELIYQYNSKWAFGARAGWTHGYSSGDNKYTFSLGANWTPTKWLLIKPELRYDKYEDATPFNIRVKRDGEKYITDKSLVKNDQLSGGISAIVKF
ncbi:MAG: porin [Planctomycetaceae bacterium]|nr:porin [Planctomycetaceae bacterium]